MCRVSGRNDVPMWVTSRYWRPETWDDSLGCQCRWDGSKKRKRSTFVLLWLILVGEPKEPTFFLLLRYETPGVGQALSHSDLEAVNITIKTEKKNMSLPSLGGWMGFLAVKEKLEEYYCCSWIKISTAESRCVSSALPIFMLLHHLGNLL